MGEVYRVELWSTVVSQDVATLTSYDSLIQVQISLSWTEAISQVNVTLTGL